MSEIAPQLREKFESLPIDLKNTILERNVTLNTLSDLMKVLESIIEEAS